MDIIGTPVTSSAGYTEVIELQRTGLQIVMDAAVKAALISSSELAAFLECCLQFCWFEWIVGKQKHMSEKLGKPW